MQTVNSGFLHIILEINSIILDDIKCVDVLVHTAIHNELSLNAILKWMDKAALSLYTPKSFEEKDYHLGQLLHQIGGIAAAELGQKALGLPSLCMLRCKAVVGNIQVSSRYLSVLEIATNIQTIFLDGFEGSKLGYVLMIDEIAVENHLRYDALTNHILGTCHEHSKTVSLDFDSMEEVELISRSLTDGTVHFAEEVCSLY